MATQRNLYNVVAFDPGGVTGWAYFSVHKRAFTKSNNKILSNLVEYDWGEFDGSENEQIQKALDLIRQARFGDMPFTSDCDVVTEDFVLLQTIGGKELLSPVRINAALDFALYRNFNGVALKLNYQSRSVRTGITRERLQLWGFPSVKGKDALAAVQHAITWLRRVKLGKIPNRTHLRKLYGD